MYTINDVNNVSKILNIQFNNFSKEDLLEGINIESEHGLINPKTNVTDNSLILTTKIALAHLNEFPNYYNKEYGLKKFEEFLKKNNTHS